LKNDFYILSNKWFSGGKDVIEQFEKSLPLYLGNGLANSQSDDVTVTDELLIGRVGQHESVLRPLKEGRKTRRPGKHLSQAMKLFAGTWARSPEEQFYRLRTAQCAFIAKQRRNAGTVATTNWRHRVRGTLDSRMRIVMICMKISIRISTCNVSPDLSPLRVRPCQPRKG
jgi:hypothetical protein